MATQSKFTQDQIQSEIDYFANRGIQATEFLARLSLAYRSKHFDYSRIHASEIGFCDRRVLAHHQDLFPDTAPDWPFLDDYNVSMLKGLVIHATLPDWYPGIVYEKEIEFEYKDLPFIFHMDGYDQEEHRIIEVKTSGSFKSITSAPDIFDGYAMQVHAYMLGSGEDKAELFVYHVNASKKFEDLTEIIKIHKSKTCLAAIDSKIRRWKRLQWFQQPVAPLWECKHCPYLDIYCEKRFEANG